MSHLSCWQRRNSNSTYNSRKIPAGYICIFHVIYLLQRPHVSFLRNATTEHGLILAPFGFPYQSLPHSLLTMRAVCPASLLLHPWDFIVCEHVLEHFLSFINIPCITLAGLSMPKIAPSFGREVLIVCTLWCPFCQILSKYQGEHPSPQAIKCCWGLQCLPH